MKVEVQSQAKERRSRRNARRSAESRRHTMQALGGVHEHLGKAELGFLRKAATTDPDEFVREYATSAVIRAAEGCRPGALEALGEILVLARARWRQARGVRADTMNRALAADALGRLSSRIGPEQIHSLKRAAANDPDSGVQVHALEALGAAARADRAGAREALAELLQQPQAWTLEAHRRYPVERIVVEAFLGSMREG